jgi:aspartate-semialdehyde dehydrogenase
MLSINLEFVMTNKIPVAVLGATGTVGQKAIALIENHSQFFVAEVMASERNVGKVYKDACSWREAGSSSERVNNLIIKSYQDLESKYVISALPSDIAREVEVYLASKGTHVFSNASAFRMNSKTPILIPEINGSHFELTSLQETPGKIITNSNCSTAFLCMALGPLREAGTIKHVSVTTLQALSGAGYPGVSSFDLIGNVIPNIGGEEEIKIAAETKKILGSANTEADFDMTVHVNRVPVVHGHSMSLHIFFEEEVNTDKVYEIYRNMNEMHPGMYQVYTDEFMPQPARCLEWDDQRVHIGRIKQGGSSNVIGLVALGHNLVRGAAGAAVLNMQYAINEGRL